MLTHSELLIEAYRTGHAWNPAFPNLRNLDEGRVLLMSGAENDAVDLLRSRQMSDSNYELLVQAYHQRFPYYDGQPGPATQALVELTRCPLPDFTPPPNASFHYDDPELQAAVETMQATGTGSIPAGCYGTANVHEVKASYDTSRLSSQQREWFPEIKARHTFEVAQIGLKIIEVPVGERANINFYGRSFGGSTIGMAGFLGSSCGANVFCTISPGYAPDLVMVLILVMHEHGHCWNCNHRPGYIMNPSIRRVKPKWVERDAAGKIIYEDPSYTADLRRFFGGGPLVGIPVPPVPVPPGPPIPIPPLPFYEFTVPAGTYQIVAKSPTVPPIIF